MAWKLKAARAAGRVCFFDDWSLSEKTDEVGILKNPGFGEGLKGYAHIPGVVIEEGNTVSGSNALHVNVTAASKFYQTVAVKPETKYRWSFWIKASSADIAAYRNYLVVEEFQRVFETNLVWNFTIVRQAALRMKEHHKGAIVFFSSNTAYRAIPNRSAYSASKGGINAMSKAFAIDLGPYGIRSNVVLPGTIKTARWVEMGSKQIENGTLTPIGDISDFEDIANAAFYLGTDLSKNVTGTEITVDGGMSCQLYPQILNELKRKAQENNL